MPEINTYVDIDINDFVSALSRRDVEELLDELDYQGYINKEIATIDSSNKMGLMEKMFVEKMGKLTTCYYQLTPDEEKTLESLFKKYV
jgi:hypothetical protein